MGAVAPVHGGFGNHLGHSASISRTILSFSWAENTLPTPVVGGRWLVMYWSATIRGVIDATMQGMTQPFTVKWLQWTGDGYPFGDDGSNHENPSQWGINVMSSSETKS